MRQYQIPTNPANDTWVKAYETEMNGALNVISAMNELGYLSLRSYSSNTIRMYPNTTVDIMRSYRDLRGFITNAITVAHASKGEFKVRCYTDQYCDLEIHVGQVSHHDERNPVFVVQLGQMYFRNVDDATIDDGDQFDPVEELYKVLSEHADSENSLSHLKERWSNAVSGVS